jgi:beta-lactamase regulating signal transducer with metallopeptidase domain
MNIHSNELKQVIEHEKNHILQKHTLDNIMMELIITVCWFNPILSLMKRELNNIHEFYADQKVTQNNQDLDSYSRLILRLSSSKDEHIPLTHQFSMYNIKQRIIMLNQKKNKNSQLIRYFMIVPCISILLLAFSCEEKSLEETNNISTIETSKVVGKNIMERKYNLYQQIFIRSFRNK